MTSSSFPLCNCQPDGRRVNSGVVFVDVRGVNALHAYKGGCSIHGKEVAAYITGCPRVPRRPELESHNGPGAAQTITCWRVRPVSKSSIGNRLLLRCLISALLRPFQHFSIQTRCSCCTSCSVKGHDDNSPNSSSPT